MRITNFSPWSSNRPKDGRLDPAPKDIVRMVATGDTASLEAAGREILAHDYSEFGYGRSLLKVIIRISPPEAMHDALCIAMDFGAVPSTEEVNALNKKIKYYQSRNASHASCDATNEENMTHILSVLRREIEGRKNPKAPAPINRAPAPDATRPTAAEEIVYNMRISLIRKALDNVDDRGLYRLLSTLPKSDSKNGPLFDDYGHGFERSSLLNRIVDLHVKQGLESHKTLLLVDLALSRGAVPDYDLLRRVNAMKAAAANFKEGDPARTFTEALYAALFPTSK